MTAEVAVMNRHGVALAADSAVTVTGPYGTKIYNTVNKLFTLSKYHPIGIMVYSSAELMRVPVETVIKHFRERHLGKVELKTLEEYARRFRTFIESDQEMFNEESRHEHFIQVGKNQINAIKDFIDGRMNEYFESEAANQSVEEAYRRIRGTVLQSVENALATGREISDLPAEDKAKLLNELEVHALPYFKAMLWNDEHPMTTEEEEQVKRVLGDLLLKIDVPDMPGCPRLRSGETGFVIAGFGESEFFPCLQAFEFVFSYGGAIRYSRSTDVKIGGSKSGPDAMIIPFAQTDMIKTFMEGRHPAYDGLVAQSAKGFFDDQLMIINAQKTKDSTKQKEAAHIESMKMGLIERMKKDLARWTVWEQSSPTMQTVAALPKEELAVLAEALVNLTIHKRKASPDAETVGPPTDVAVISKGDGFIWIKRKHYFRPELNPHFVHNYFPGD